MPHAGLYTHIRKDMHVNDELPPLQGKFDDVRPDGDDSEVAALGFFDEENELDQVAVLGYN
jgi:hypothetical protein